MLALETPKISQAEHKLVLNSPAIFAIPETIRMYRVQQYQFISSSPARLNDLNFTSPDIC